jgi:hypothetical protein
MSASIDLNGGGQSGNWKTAGRMNLIIVHTSGILGLLSAALLVFVGQSILRPCLVTNFSIREKFQLRGGVDSARCPLQAMDITVLFEHDRACKTISPRWGNRLRASVWFQLELIVSGG